jgi:lipid II:glycine glycyltransferase (peptidoglycan interpeptide bridge formation enzyme)
VNTTTVREITEAEREYWNKEVEQFKSADPLNAFEWGLVRRVDGWNPIYLCAERSGKCCGAMMILKKRIPFTPYSIMYAQEMPLWNEGDDETLRALICEAVKVGERERAILLRISPGIPEGSMQDGKDYFVALGFKHLDQRWSFWNSPRDVARVDLTAFDSPDDYFERLPKKTRASARKARREGVLLETATSKTDLKKFYEMFCQFSVERGFMVRDYAYQEMLWDTYLERGMGRLVIARLQGKVVGGSLDLIFAGKCIGMHGGSLQAHRGLGIDDAVNSEVIMWAKSSGCSWYSFRGLGSTPSQEAYKRKFLINVVSSVGYYDFPFRPTLYKLFHLSEFGILPRSWPLIMLVRRALDRVKRLLQSVIWMGQRQVLETDQQN